MFARDKETLLIDMLKKLNINRTFLATNFTCLFLDDSPFDGETPVIAVLDNLVGVHDDGDEEGEDHVGEQAHEHVQVHAAVGPHHRGPVLRECVKRREHVVPVDEREERLRGGHQAGELVVIGPQDEPAGQHKAGVEEAGAEQEPEDVGRRALHREDEHVVGAEEAEVAEQPKPDQQAAGAEQQAGQVPQVAGHLQAQLNGQLGQGGEDDEDVVGADHHVPQVEKGQLLVFGQLPAEVGPQEVLRLVAEQLGAQDGAQAEEQRGRAHGQHRAVKREHQGCGHAATTTTVRHHGWTVQSERS